MKAVSVGGLARVSGRTCVTRGNRTKAGAGRAPAGCSRAGENRLREAEELESRAGLAHRRPVCAAGNGRTGPGRNGREERGRSDPGSGGAGGIQDVKESSEGVHSSVSGCMHSYGGDKQGARELTVIRHLVCTEAF
ncbi:uncharacterized protein LOC144579080 [Callithrix jacchus]